MTVDTGRNSVRSIRGGFCLAIVALMIAAPGPWQEPASAQIPASGGPAVVTSRPRSEILGDRWPLMFTWSRNKVNWWDLSWRYTELPHTTLYYYSDAERIARLATPLVLESDRALQEAFQYDLQTYTENKTIPKIIYTSHHTFEQTNTIAQVVPEGVLGFTEFIKGRVVFPYTGGNYDFRHVLEHENTHIHMIHKLKHVFKANGIFDVSKLLPTLWFSEGLAEFESAGRDPVTDARRMDPETEMYVRDALLNDSLPTLREMRLFPDWRRIYKFGHALTQYFGARFGTDRVHSLLSQWHHLFPNRRSYNYFRRRQEDSWDRLNPGVEQLEPWFVRFGEHDYPVSRVSGEWQAEVAGGMVDSLSGQSVSDLVADAENLQIDERWYRIVLLPSGENALYRPDSGLQVHLNGVIASRILREHRLDYEKKAYRLFSFEKLLEWWFDTDLDQLTTEWHEDIGDYYRPWLVGRDHVADFQSVGVSAPELWPTASDDGRIIFYKAYHDDYIYTAVALDRESGQAVQLAEETGPEIESIHILAEGGDVRRIAEDRYLTLFTAQRRSRDVVYTQEIRRLPDGTLQLSGQRELGFDPLETGLIALTGVRFAGGTDRVLLSGLGLDGYQDIFLVDIESGVIERRLTHDLASDRMPVLWNNTVVFASDRASPPTTFAYHLFTYDLETGALAQITESSGNEINPTVSPDGEQLFFQSDATGVSNIYLWREGGTPFQVTDVTTGFFTPAPVTSDTLIVSGFYDTEYLLYQIPVPETAAGVENAPDRTVAIGAHAPRETRLITLHREWAEDRVTSADLLASELIRSEEYRPRFSLDDFYASSQFGGYSAYNAAIFGTGIRFSDILGNHHINGALWNGPRRGLEDLSWIMSYWNQKGRVKAGVSLFKTSGVYYNWARQAFYYRDRAGIAGQLNIPFSVFSDLDLYLGTATERRRLGTVTGSIEFDLLELGIGYTRDVSVWTSQGPHSGWVASIYYDYLLNTSENFDVFSRYLIADVRGYLPLHRHIVAAARVAGGHSTGTEPEFFFLGGGFFLRGYWDLYSLYGTSYNLINTELRLQPFELLDMKPPRMFEQSGWPIQLVFFADWAETVWQDAVQGPKGAGGVSLRLTLALPFIVEYAWYRKNMWDRSKGRDRGLLVTLMF